MSQNSWTHNYKAALFLQHKKNKRSNQIPSSFWFYLYGITTWPLFFAFLIESGGR